MLLDSYKKDVLQLSTPIFMNFEIVQRKGKFILDSKEIFYSSYIPEKNQVLLNFKKYFNDHYIQESYNPNSPNISNLKWLRTRCKPRELSSIRCKRSNENSRICTTIQNNNMLGDVTDLKMIINPNWRESDKQKSMTRNGFKVRLKTQFKGQYDQQAWNTFNDYSNVNKYTGGYSEIGDISRKRDKTKEASPRCFTPMNPPDTWKNRLNTSNSLRTYAAEKVIKDIKIEELKKNIIKSECEKIKLKIDTDTVTKTKTRNQAHNTEKMTETIDRLFQYHFFYHRLSSC